LTDTIPNIGVSNFCDVVLTIIIIIIIIIIVKNADYSDAVAQTLHRGVTNLTLNS